jgi:hypothetical protein
VVSREPGDLPGGAWQGLSNPILLREQAKPAPKPVARAPKPAAPDTSSFDRALRELEAHVKSAQFEAALATADVGRAAAAKLGSAANPARTAQLEVLAATAALALGRPDDARQSFARALDSDRPEARSDHHATEGGARTRRGARGARPMSAWRTDGNRGFARAIGARCAAIAAAGLAGVTVSGCALWPDGEEPAPPARGPVRIRVEMFGGFPAPPAAAARDRVALLVDATDSMGRPAETGTPRVRAARAAAQRFVAALGGEAELTLFAFGNEWEARCDTPAVAHTGSRDAVSKRISALRAGGDGSLALALDAFAAPEKGGFDRVVAITGLGDRCGGDLCAAVDGLAARGVRLDLVVVGGAAVPDCVSELAHRETVDTAGDWPVRGPVGFHVESTGPDAAVLVCGESGGLPVEVLSGRSAVVVKLDPPLRLERSFMPGTRWLLQVLDFPALDPPERQWRWVDDGPPPVATQPDEEAPAAAEPAP